MSCKELKTVARGLGDGVLPAEDPDAIIITRVVLKTIPSQANVCNMLSISSIAQQIGKSLQKWISQQTDRRLRNLQENSQYSLSVTPSASDRGSFKVIIRCSMCKTDISLQQKDRSNISSPFLISNWTRHIKKCYTESDKHATPMQQSPISNFLFANKTASNLQTEILPGGLLATSGTSTGTLTATTQSTGTSSGTSTVVSPDLELSLDIDLGSSLEVEVSSPSLDNTHNQDFPQAPPHSGEGGGGGRLVRFFHFSGQEVPG